MDINFSNIFGAIGVIFGISGGIVAFFAKREVAGNDATKAQSASNASDIALMKQTIEQLKTDINRVEDMAREIETNYKESVQDLFEKVDEVLKAIQSIQVTCSAHLAREAAIAQFQKKEISV